MLTIVIPLVLVMFVQQFADSITSNWIVYKTCYDTLGYSKSECALLGSSYPDNYTAILEKQVEPYSANIIMVNTVIGQIGTPFVMFFLGPWSDKYGRKPVILLSIGGMAVQYFIIVGICEMRNVSAWYILLSAVPLCLSGGCASVMAFGLCYIYDLTLPEKRGIKIATFYATAYLGLVLGSTVCSYALQLLGYSITYLTASASLVLAWLIVWYFLQESVKVTETNDRYYNLFKLSLLKETVNTVFKKRSNHDRAIIFTVQLMLVCYLLSDNNDGIRFLYMREKLNWSLKKYSIYSAIDTVISIFLSIGAIYFLHKMLKLPEFSIIMIGFISKICKCIFIGLADKDWYIYLGSAMGGFQGIVLPISKVALSRNIQSDEYGKIFSFIAFIELLISPLGPPLFTYVYSQTMITFPGSFSLVAAGILMVGVVATAWSILLVSAK